MWITCRVQIGTPRFKETGIGTQDRDPGPGPRTRTGRKEESSWLQAMLEWVECIMVLTTPIFTLFTSLFPFWQQKRNMKLNFCVFAIATFSGASIKCISAEDVSHLVSCEEESRSGQMTCYDGEAGCISHSCSISYEIYHNCSLQSMIGNANMQQSPTFASDIEKINKLRRALQQSRQEPRTLRGANSTNKSKAPKEKMSKSAKSAKCDVSKIELSDYEQWKAEQGYWIGEYTFLQKDGIPNVSAMELSLSVL